MMDRFGRVAKVQTNVFVLVPSRLLKPLSPHVARSGSGRNTESNLKLKWWATGLDGFCQLATHRTDAETR
jgi:hypothetical protein